VTQPLCDLLGIETPIILAPMGGAGGPRLSAAVSNAGGLGTLPLWVQSIENLRASIGEQRALSARPFAVNLRVSQGWEQHFEACIEEEVPIISMFWGLSPTAIDRAKSKGILVMQSVGPAALAREAVEAGADVIVAQGWEAGGHVWGNVATMALIPAVVDVVGDVPVVAAGGIADGRGYAAAKALGASGVWIGTRFLASPEAHIHEDYQRCILSACEDDTGHFPDLFDGGWPDAPHRVIVNSTVRDWEKAGKPAPGQRPNQGESVAETETGASVLRYASHTPGDTVSGNVEAMSMWAGQGVAQVKKVMPAGDILREIADDAAEILQNLR